MHERGDDLTILHALQRTCGRYVSGIDQAFCYVTTTGRRTGNPHRVEIWFANRPSSHTVYVLAGGRDRADFVRNALADPHVTIEIGGRGGEATARVIEADSPEDAVARRLLLAKYQQPAKDDLESWGATALPVAFDLGPWAGALSP